MDELVEVFKTLCLWKSHLSVVNFGSSKNQDFYLQFWPFWITRNEPLFDISLEKNSVWILNIVCYLVPFQFHFRFVKAKKLQTPLDSVFKP